MNVIEKFQNDKQNIIQAFINYYGENNAEYIIKKINEVNIVWYDAALDNHIITDLPKEKVEEFLKCRKKEVFNQSAYIDELNLLVLPQNYDITQIVHEMNHMMGSHIKTLAPYFVINGVSFDIEKDNGIIQYNTAMNETINHLMTVDIVGELKKIGIVCRINIHMARENISFNKSFLQ